MQKKNIKKSLIGNKCFSSLITASLFAVSSLQGAQPLLIDNFVNKVADSDGVKNFWQTEAAPNFVITEHDNMLNFDLSGGGGAKYAAVRSTKKASSFNFFNSRKVFYVKKMRKSGGAAGIFRFEVTGSIAKYSSAPDAIWVEVNGQNVDLFIKKNTNTVVTRSIALETECVMFILELNATKYYLKSYCQVVRPNDPSRKNQIRIQTMSGNHTISQNQWGNSGNAYLGISAERTANSGVFHYDLAELRVVNFSDISSPNTYYDVFANGAPPGVDTTDPYYKKGFLNVKNPPYNAAGDGIQDDTAALQNAINDGYEYDLITYIPGGTYLIHDKLMGVQKAIIKKPGNWDNDGYDTTGTFSVMNGKSYQTYTVLGDDTNPPVIKLADGASGFDSTSTTFTPNDQREIFQIWSQPNGVQVNYRDALSEDPIESSTGLLYNIEVRDIQIDMGANEGAIGFNVAGSQGCNISNIHVSAPAGYGFACFRDLGGVGGGNINLTGIGCKYGVYTNPIESSYPHITGLRLENQSVAAIYHDFHNPLVITGARIIKDAGPVFTMQSGHYSGGHISLIDTEIIFNNTWAGKAITNTANRNLHLHNVYIKNANKVTKNVLSNGTGWTHVREYAWSDKNANSMINGTVSTSTPAQAYSDILRYASAPTENFLDKHLPPSGAIPGVKAIVGTNGNNGTAISIKDSQIAGDSDNSDWHAEIQEAIDRFDTIFIPKGTYKVSQQLVLKANTKLIGVGQYWSTLDTHNNWSSALNTALLKAPNGTKPVISNFKIKINQAKGNAAVLWRGKTESISRSIKVATASGTKLSKAVQVWKFSSQGGGRHYGNLITAGSYKNHDDFRIIQVDGTTNPLAIYGINSETSKRPHHEIKNATNVYIFSIKNEVGGKVLDINNSTNILVAGQGGKIIPSGVNDGIVSVSSDCNNITVANICPLKKNGSGYNVKFGNSRIDFPTLVSIMKNGLTPIILPFGSSSQNNAPVVANISNKNVNESATLTVTISATDADNDTIVLSASNLPSFGSLNDNGDGTGSIVFTPSYANSGTYAIDVIADDGNGGTDTDPFTLTVNNVNRAPVVSNITNKSCNENTTLSVSINSSDADGDPLTISATGLPAFATLTDNGNGTGTIVFSPSYFDSGVYSIQVTADDGNGGTDTDPFTLTVNNINRAPVIAAMNNVSGDENSTINRSISSTDPDGDSITLSINNMPPFGTLIDNGDGTGSLQFSPSYTDSGSYTIEVQANDGNTGIDTESFILTINNVNQAPSLNAIADQIIEAECIHSLNITASDPDSDDTLVLSANALPSFATLTDNGDGTGSIVFAPSTSDIGTNTITVSVDDGNQSSNTDSVTCTLTINSGFTSYRTDFSNGSPADDFTSGISDFSIASGELTTNTPGNWTQIYLKNTLFPETTETFKIVTRMKSGTAVQAWNGAAVRFRFINGSNWYELQVRSNAGSDVRIYGKENGATRTLGEWDLDLNPAEWNTFALDVSGSQVSLYHGNSLVGSGTMSLTTGRIGVRQRADSGHWDYFRVIAPAEADYLEDFDDTLAQDWNVNTTEMEIIDTGSGDYALSQVAGQAWKFATYNQVVAVDQNYTVSVDGRASDTRTKAFDSPSLLLKYTDAQNWIAVYINQSVTSSSAEKIVLKKKIGNIATQYDLASTASLANINLNDPNTWHNIEVQVNGSSLTVWVNGTPETVDHIEADLMNPVFDGNPRCGVRTPSAGQIQFDNFAFFEEYE